MVSVGFEPVGRWFEVYLRRRIHTQSISLSSEPKGDGDDSYDDIDEIDDDGDDELTEDDKTFLLSLDSNEWKKQDHYRVLGIKDRFCATEDEIKLACEWFVIVFIFVKWYLMLSQKFDRLNRS